MIFAKFGSGKPSLVDFAVHFLDFHSKYFGVHFPNSRHISNFVLKFHGRDGLCVR